MGIVVSLSFPVSFLPHPHISCFTAYFIICLHLPSVPPPPIPFHLNICVIQNALSLLGLLYLVVIILYVLTVCMGKGAQLCITHCRDLSHITARYVQLL